MKTTINITLAITFEHDSPVDTNTLVDALVFNYPDYKGLDGVEIIDQNLVEVDKVYEDVEDITN